MEKIDRIIRTAAIAVCLISWLLFLNFAVRYYLR